MIQRLKELGLSELEARCYLTLHEEPHLSGYEVAKRVSTSRTNVYAALRSLTDKGICRIIEGDPVHYDVVPIDQLIRYMRVKFEQTAKGLVNELKSPPRSKPSFYNWQGNKHLDTAIRRMIANAKKNILVDIWAEDVHWVEEALLDAEERGITIVLIVLGECQISLKNVFIHKADDLEQAWPKMGTRKFSILIDGQAALLGGFGGDVKLTALETDHPAITELLKNAFYHDVVMMRIEEDFGAELASRYGENYEKIINYYIREKGWDF
ncbi:TrmB family transcriptional regulator [Laceyella sacchari]|uniref:TrmB family transcriptional regulator n=1 Tax=Laceyella tengchongensis TaxID=574699 RepID=UPI000C9F2FAF|nr:helix-turn-helix domain-containing protein [Laceyella tengchongensis]AUS08850.1 TrmB family transcriptional regulator [Laceyella sacchari]